MFGATATPTEIDENVSLNHASRISEETFFFTVHIRRRECLAPSFECFSLVAICPSVCPEFAFRRRDKIFSPMKQVRKIIKCLLHPVVEGHVHEGADFSRPASMFTLAFRRANGGVGGWWDRKWLSERFFGRRDLCFIWLSFSVELSIENVETNIFTFSKRPLMAVEHDTGNGAHAFTHCYWICVGLTHQRWRRQK